MRMSERAKSITAGVIGGLLLVGAVAAGVLTVRSAWDERAYARALPCRPAAGVGAADCVRQVAATAHEVTDHDAARVHVHELTVSTRGGPRRLSFPRDNTLLRTVTRDEGLILDQWRGHTVAVEADGRTTATEDAPPVAFSEDLGFTLACLGGAGFALATVVPLSGWTATAAHTRTDVLAGAAMVVLFLGGVVLLYGGWELVTDADMAKTLTLTGTGLALVLVLAAVFAGLVWAKRA